jgi:hypothetical protein
MKIEKEYQGEEEGGREEDGCMRTRRMGIQEEGLRWMKRMKVAYSMGIEWDGSGQEEWRFKD